MVAGGVNRFPALTLAGGALGGRLVANLGAADTKLKDGGGSSKLGKVRAAGRRTFKGADNGSSAVPIPGTARVARFAGAVCTT